LTFKSGACEAVLSPIHTKTTLLGILPLPRAFFPLDLRLAMHGDGEGWDLTAGVKELQVQLIAFSGPIRCRRQLDASSKSSGQFVAGFHHLVLFDGHCILCNALVDFISRNDPERIFMFAPQQSTKAASLLESLGLNHIFLVSPVANGSSAHTGAGKSMLLVTPGGVLHERAAAALRCGAALAGPWSWLARGGLAVTAMHPDVLVNGAYNYVARNRYK